MKIKSGGTTAAAQARAMRFSLWVGAMFTATIPTMSAANERPATPPANNTELFVMKKALASGENAVAFADYGKAVGMESTRRITVEDQEVTVNDQGMGPDVIAGDGIYSGFVTIDKEGILADANAYKARLKKLTSRPKVLKFAGRQVVGEMYYDQQKVPKTRIPKEAIHADLGLTALAEATDLPPVLSATFAKDKVLFITDSSVITDSTRTFAPCNVATISNGSVGTVDGPWSFKTLMREMAGVDKTDPDAKALTQEFIHDWLLNWMSNQTVNGFTISQRPAIQAFFPGWNGTQSSTLNIDKLPFRLLAIVNRMDLAGKSAYGEPPSSGETRFIFGLVDSSNNGCVARPMTVILEYGNTTGSSCAQIKTQATSWQALDSQAFGASFNTALQALTDQVTTRNAAPAKSNGSAISQIRTNDYAFTSSVTEWQLREFKLSSNPDTSSSIKYILTSAPLAQTPDWTSMNNTANLSNYLSSNSYVPPRPINQDPTGILCNNYSVPLAITDSVSRKSVPFKAGAMNYNASFYWQAVIQTTNLPATFPACYHGNTTATLSSNPSNIWAETRAIFALNTCNGCHGPETNTTLSHVSWGTPNVTLSSFLNGPAIVPDPTGASVDGTGVRIIRKFDDLARRAQIVEDQAAKSCTTINSAEESFAAQQKRMSFTH